MSFFSPLNVRVGFFLAVRQIRRASKWTTILIVSVMVLTFLNLVAVTGVLVGLIEGISNSYRIQYTGDVIISPLSTKSYILRSDDVLSLVRSLPQVTSVSPRHLRGGSVEANYLTRADLNEKRNLTGAQIIGINPAAEDELSHLSDYVIKGQYLASSDYDQVLIGAYLLEEYSFGEQPGLTPLKNIVPGTKVRLTIGDNTREVIVKGIIKSKVDQISLSVYLNDGEFRQMAGVNNYDLSQIAIRLTQETDAAA